MKDRNLVLDLLFLLKRGVDPENGRHPVRSGSIAAGLQTRKYPFFGLDLKEVHMMRLRMFLETVLRLFFPFPLNTSYALALLKGGEPYRSLDDLRAIAIRIEEEEIY